MQMLHCKHRSLSAADGGGFTAAAARTARGKSSEAAQSNRAGTASLGYLIPLFHEGKWHAVEKKNVPHTFVMLLSHNDPSLSFVPTAASRVAVGFLILIASLISFLQ